MAEFSFNSICQNPSFARQMQIEIGHKKYQLKDILESGLEGTSDFEKEYFSEIKKYFNSIEITFHTSGSTGKPRPISFPKDAIVNSINLTARTFNLADNSRVLHCLPLKYVAGQMMLYRTCEMGWDTHIIEPQLQLGSKMKGQYDFAAMIPAQLDELIQTSPEKLEDIKILIVGGAAMNETLKRRIQDTSCEIYETYGMTETLTHIAVRRINGNSSSQYFKSLEGIQLNQGEHNNLIIHAPHISEDEIITNDIVEFEDFTEFRIIGRKDRVINTGGVKIQAEVLENKIANLIDRPFYISSLPHEKYGEIPVLYLEGDVLDAVTLKLLEESLKERLNKHERPKQIICLKKFDRTAGGKIKFKK